MTGGEIALRFLESQGMGTAFGIPGALNGHLYDALHRVPGFRHVLVRHELGGAWMADGYARSSNREGVVFTVPGPGATHAASGIAGAYTDCSRVLLLSSQSESRLRGEFRRDLFHGLDQQRLFAGITKWSGAVRRVEEILPILSEAVHHLRRDRPGPVQVEIPADVLGMEAGEPALPGVLRPAVRRPDAAALSRAGSALRAARRPLILAGDGVLHAGASGELGRLAEVLRAPVVTTVMGKGALSERHPWSLGDSNSEPGSRAYREHDLLLAVGVRFVQVDTRWGWFFPPGNLVHVDADEREIGRAYPPAVGIAADPRAALQDLLASLEGHAGSDGWAEFPDLQRASEARIGDPFLSALRRALPDSSLVAFDVCVPGFLSRKDWLAPEPYGCYYPGVYVGMGFGLPVGIGAAIARPDRPVCVVAGDGGFQMTMAELGTAVQERLKLLAVVVNDAGLTLIRRYQDRELGGRRCEVDLVNPDFTRLAESYGIRNVLARSADEVEAAAADWARQPALTVVEYRT